MSSEILGTAEPADGFCNCVKKGSKLGLALSASSCLVASILLAACGAHHSTVLFTHREAQLRGGRLGANLISLGLFRKVDPSPGLWL